VLQVLNFLQLVLYIPLLALLGQGVLFVLAGHKRQENFFYQLLQLISKPFTLLVRKATPAKVSDQHVPIVTFFLLLIVYAVVTFEKISLCLSVGVGACR
jgi:cytochrome b561